MPLPSFHAATEHAQTWSIPRAAAYGAGLGALAALFKTLGALHGSGSAPALVLEVAGAAAAFALLCAGAAVLRNVLARRFIWREMR
jgi:hypothetical protein